MKMTQEADNAVRIVHYLSTQTQRKGAEEIAQNAGMTHRFALKTLGKLSASGIVRSYKGKNGGYELSRPAAEISLREVIETVDGPYLFNRCAAESHVCAVGNCSLKNTFVQLSREISERLEQITFDSFL